MDRKNLDGVKGTIRSVEGFLEIAILTLAYYLTWRYAYDPVMFGNMSIPVQMILLAVYALLMIVLFHNFDGFQFGYLQLTEVLVCQIIAVFIVNFITYLQLCVIANRMISVWPLILLSLGQTVIALICTYLYTRIYHQLYPPKNMVMIFGRDDAIDLKFKMDTRSDKYRITKLISVKEGFTAISRQIPNYDAVIISDVSAQIRNDLLKFCYSNGIRAYVTPKMSDLIVKGATDICLFDTPLLLVRSRGLTLTQRIVKRAMDIILSALATVIAAPIMLIVAVAIKIEDGGPVFFKQERVTLNNKRFNILKFRSMIVDAEKDGISQPAVDHDPRITKVGRVIRATRVDELPQILNILKGDMSIVGPRPERVEHVEEYTKAIPEFAFRLKAKGGLTGYAQVYGKYNTTPYDKLRLDLMYIENYSLMLDIKLILMTIRIMLKKESTEGFNERQEIERLKAEMLERLHAEKEADVGITTKEETPV